MEKHTVVPFLHNIAQNPQRNPSGAAVLRDPHSPHNTQEELKKNIHPRHPSSTSPRHCEAPFPVLGILFVVLDLCQLDLFHELMHFDGVVVDLLLGVPPTLRCFLENLGKKIS